MLKRVGSERLTTQAYNPRANGLTERANQTIMQMLRKHAEANTERWNEWLPYIELSYNSRVHSSTKFSPYEILYGFKMRSFKDWSNEDKDMELMILKRAIQIKELIEGKRIDAKNNIEQAQIKQREIQDKRNNTTEEILEKGTQIRLKVEG